LGKVKAVAFVKVFGKQVYGIGSVTPKYAYVFVYGCRKHKTIVVIYVLANNVDTPGERNTLPGAAPNCSLKQAETPVLRFFFIA
jgi:hypothetical protein